MQSSTTQANTKRIHADECERLYPVMLSIITIILFWLNQLVCVLQFGTHPICL